MQVSHVYALLAARTHSARREFNPSWITVAKAWSKVPSSKRDSHFFATVEFEGNPALFQKVVFSFTHDGLRLNGELDGIALCTSCPQLPSSGRSPQVSRIRHSCFLRPLQVSTTK